MTKVIAVLFIISSGIYGKEALPKSLKDRLIGTWKSDKEKTIKFNEEYAKLKPKQKAVLNQMIGRMIIVYKSGGKFECKTPAYSLMNGDKKIDMAASEMKSGYKVLGYDSDSIVMESTDDTLGKMIYRLHFEDEDTYWIYLSDGLLNLHAREYFTKVKKAEQNRPAKAGQ